MRGVLRSRFMCGPVISTTRASTRVRLHVLGHTPEAAEAAPRPPPPAGSSLRIRQRAAARVATLFLETPLDALIPFVPSFVFAYLLYCPWLLLPLLVSRREHQLEQCSPRRA